MIDHDFRPGEVSPASDRRELAAETFAALCFFEAFGTDLVRLLPDNKQAIGRLLLDVGYELAISDTDLTDPIIQRWDRNLAEAIK